MYGGRRNARLGRLLSDEAIMTESRRSTTGEQGTERGSYGYLYLLQPDGLGTQFVYISLLLDYARKAGGGLIVDFSNMTLFASAGASAESANLRTWCPSPPARSFTGGPRSTASCERDTPCSALRSTRRTRASRSASPFPRSGLGSSSPCFRAGTRPRLARPTVAGGDVRRAVCLLHRQPCRGAGCRYLRDRLTLNGDYRRRFRDYQAHTAGALGVHARFGNGEEQSVASRDRFAVPWERFFTLMDAASEESRQAPAFA